MNSIIENKAYRINELHEIATLSARKTIETVIEAGGLLTEVKNELKHGEFNEWCKQNLNLSRTTIYRYMTIHSNKELIKEAQTPSEAIKQISGESFKMKHLKDGLYLKLNAGSVLTIYVNEGFIGWVNYLGNSYTSFRSFSIDVYNDVKNEMNLPYPDNSFYFVKAGFHVPNEWQFLNSGWLSTQIEFFKENVPEKFWFTNQWTPIE